MNRERDFQAEITSGFKVQGDRVSATFDVLIAALQWTEAQATAFTGAVYESNPDLFPYALRYPEPLVGKLDVIAPAAVQRLSFRWTRELTGPEPREKLEQEFASRRKAVLTLLGDYLQQKHRMMQP